MERPELRQLLPSRRTALLLAGAAGLVFGVSSAKEMNQNHVIGYEVAIPENTGDRWDAWPLALNYAGCKDEEYRETCKDFVKNELKSTVSKVPILGEKIGNEAANDPDLNVATRDQISQAVTNIKTKGGQSCPEIGPYHIPLANSENSAATVCLNNATVTFVESGDNGIPFALFQMEPSAVVADEQASPSLSLTMREFSQEKCAPYTDRMKAYGSFLLESDLGMPEGKSVPVEVQIEDQGNHACNTWPPRSPLAGNGPISPSNAESRQEATR